MSDHQAQVIVVGSGMNSLACAALLAKRGKSVLVLERNDRAGGCIRTEELFPGFTHEVFSSWYPLFTGGGAYAELKDDLAAMGVEFLSNGYTTGLATPDGHLLALKQDIADSVQRINAMAPQDGDAFGAMADQLFGRDAALTFGLLGNSPYSGKVFKLLFSEWRKRGIDGLLGFTADSIENFRRWAERSLSSELTRALMCPWVLHTGLGPDEASSALIGKLTFAAVVAGGMPVVKGGGSRLVQGLQQFIEQKGGKLLTGIDVQSVQVSGNRATGVVDQNGNTYRATEAVVCNVTPPQLYGKLLPNVPAPVLEQAQGYRFGRGCMQIHFALNGPVPWRDPEMQKVPLVHLTESLGHVALAVTEANNGWLPRHPTIAIGQPTAVDPSRAPEGKSILWLQLQEMPSTIKGDAAGEIETPADGKWNEAVREAMADRVQQRLETVLPGLSSLVIGRKAYSPGDLEAMNCNLVGGDPYSGVCSPDQFFWFRPFAGTRAAKAHRTPYRNVYHIGASTHPGPGLGGGSGQIVADLLTR
jgi:phytoene dehydrogenase-like protein